MTDNGFRLRIAERLLTVDGRYPAGRQAAGPSDYDLVPGTRPGGSGRLTQAAVLVPIVERDDGLTVLFTRRTAHLNSHAGQISFPGGRAEDGDAGPVGTALRETAEEVGLPNNLVNVVGALDTYETVTGYEVVPVVGFVDPGYDPTPDEFEVAEIFEVPLAFLMDPANHVRHRGYFNGMERRWYAMPYGDYYIWGATAGMLMNLYHRVRD